MLGTSVWNGYEPIIGSRVPKRRRSERTIVWLVDERHRQFRGGRSASVSGPSGTEATHFFWFFGPDLVFVVEEVLGGRIEIFGSRCSVFVDMVPFAGVRGVMTQRTQ